jgi:hypothetical protein
VAVDGEAPEEFFLLVGRELERDDRQGLILGTLLLSSAAPRLRS